MAVQFIPQVDTVDWVAEKLGENRKAFKKTVSKAQDALDQCDGKANTKTETGLLSTSAVFGLSLDTLSLVLVPVTVNGLQLTLMVPPFLRDIGSKILEVASTVGLFRVPPNHRRLVLAVDEIDSGRKISELPDLKPTELAQLLKEWLKELPQRVIPEWLTPYILRLFSTSDGSLKTQLTDADRQRIMHFFGQLIPSRARAVIIFVSYVLAQVASFHVQNQMTPRNLALVCPSLFTANVGPAAASSRKFEDSINMMEYLIQNPSVFANRTTSVFHTPSFGALPKTIKFSAPFMSHSPRRGRFEFDLRTPVHSIRLMGKTTVNSVRGRFEKMKTDIKIRNSPKMSRARASVGFGQSDFSLPSATILPVVEVQCPRIPVTPHTPSPASKQVRGRPRALVRFSGSSDSPKCVGDIEMSSSSPKKGLPVRLDFEETSADVIDLQPQCPRCQELLFEMENLKSNRQTADIGTQVDLDVFDVPGTPQKLQIFAVPASSSPKTCSSGQVNISEVYARASNISRQLSIATTIPSGIVAHRLQALTLACGRDLNLEPAALD